MEPWQPVVPAPDAGTGVAPIGQVWVCCACGKTARDLFGNERGWDESCMLNAMLCWDRAAALADQRKEQT